MAAVTVRLAIRAKSLKRLREAIDELQRALDDLEVVADVDDAVVDTTGPVR